MKYIFSIIALLFSFSCIAADADPQEKLNVLRKDMQSLTKKLTADRGKQTKVQSELREQELAINGITKELQALNEEISAQEEKLAKQEKTEQSVNQNIKKNQQQLVESIKSLHAAGQQPDLKLLFNQENPSELRRLFTYYHYFNDALQKQILELNAQRTELSSLSEEIASTKKTLEAERALQLKEQESLQGQKEKRNSLLTELERSINNKDKQLKELVASEAELKRVLTAVAQTQSQMGDFVLPPNTGAFADSRGKLPWPTAGTVQHAFGSYRTAGARQYDGLVIQAPAGQPVYAVFPGRVVYADWLRGFGLLVIIDHGSKYMSLYAHNATLFKQIGDRVQAGEQIATVGTTGGLRQPGLYFEIRQNGKAVNPQQWLGPKK